MKITFVLPYAGLAGGIRVVAIYAERLQNMGHTVFVISQPEEKVSLRDRLRSIMKEQKFISVSKNSLSHFDNLDVHHKIIESNRPITDADVPDADVVIATWWETAEWVSNLSESKGAKAYFIQHYETHDYLPIERARATYSLPIHKITIAQWLVDLMNTKYKDKNVFLVPNSVDTQQFSAPPRSKQSIPTVGMMYSPQKWKGCDISLKAFSLAKNKIEKLRLIAFGKPEFLPKSFIPYNIEYFCQPPQNKIKDIYSRCDAWLFGSRYEGFGLPILEAMACRTPVIGTSAGAAPELLVDGGGILIKPEEPESMAEAIINVCQLSNKEWQLMSEAAYTKAKNYSWQDAAKLFETALYKIKEA